MTTKDKLKKIRVYILANKRASEEMLVNDTSGCPDAEHAVIYYSEQLLKIIE